MWNMFDFGCAAREMKAALQAGIIRGLVTLDRKIKKDAFIFIKRIGAGSRLCICADGGMPAGPGCGPPGW